MKGKTDGKCTNCKHRAYIYSPIYKAKVLTCKAEKCNFERKESKEDDTERVR